MNNRSASVAAIKSRRNSFESLSREPKAESKAKLKPTLNKEQINEIRKKIIAKRLSKITEVESTHGENIMIQDSHCGIQDFIEFNKSIQKQAETVMKKNPNKLP